MTRFQETRLDGWVLAFTGALALFTSLLFGLWPAWHTSHANAQHALKSGAHGSSDAPTARRSRELLIIVEVALTLVLLSAAALVLKSFAKTTSLPLGFEPRELLTARVDLPSPAYEDEKKLIGFSNASARETPRASRCAACRSGGKSSSHDWLANWIFARRHRRATASPVAFRRDDRHPRRLFGALGTSLLRGRAFQPQDTIDAPPVIIVDQLMVGALFPRPGSDRETHSHADRQRGRKMRTIVGVVPHLKVYGFDETTVLPQAYVPQTQVPNTGLVLLLRTSLRAESLEKSIRQIVASLDPAQPVFEFRMMQELCRGNVGHSALDDLLADRVLGSGIVACGRRYLRGYGLQRPSPHA